MTKVLLVGGGFMGRVHGEVYRLLPGVELAGLVDKDPTAASTYSERFGVPSFSTLEEGIASVSPDVVDICLPTDLHSSYTLSALAQGCDVVCEKPMARSLEEARAMKAAAEQHGRRLMIAHCIRFWPEYEELTRLVKSGEMGGLLSLSLTRFGAFPSWSSEGWLGQEQRSGGAALDMIVHDMDYALSLLGEPDSLESRGTRDWRGMSHIFTTMTFGQTIVQVQGGWNLPPSAPFKMAYRAIFEKGAAIWDSGPLTLYPESGDPRIVEFPPMAVDGGGNVGDLGGYFGELAYFYRQREAGEGLDRVTPESSLLSLEAALTAIAKADGGPRGL